jgi:hypothetical protein
LISTGKLTILDKEQIMSEKEAVQMWINQFGDKKIKGQDVWKWVKDSRKERWQIYYTLEVGKLLQARIGAEDNYSTWQLTPEALKLIGENHER